MKLSRLIDPIEVVSINWLSIDGLPIEGISGDKRDDALDPEIASIHYRSNEVRPGGIFFAIKGQQTDGHQYIRDAINRGAAAVVVEAGHQIDDAEAVVVSVENTRKALAAGSSIFFNNPSGNLYLIGITGTNGKTTTAYLVEHLLLESGMDVGVISTINYRYQGLVYNNPLTTPESLDLQKILSEMVSAGVTHVVMEVSSHGIALDRIYYCWFDMGIYTNLSQDHLDFHGNMEEYGSCKKRFFTGYLMAGPKQKHAVAVINTDNPMGMEILSAMENFKVVSVGSNASSDVFARHIRFDQYGMSGEIRFPDKGVQFQSGLIGSYNLENIMCAAGAGMALKISPALVKQGIDSFAYVPGRLERIPDESGRHVFLDYAHTPDALENVLSTLKEVIAGRLICVFGCGGDRDKAKRPQMGKIAGKLSDFVVITSDNPRTEVPGVIIEEIRNGVMAVLQKEYMTSELENRFPENGYVIEPDRERAINLGIKIAKPDDTILIAGKGHEDYQIIGKKIIPFDDREKATAALAKSLLKVN
ncbi:MAG: UDP-N-acetylmuramoyl-L-alanyl-D-glutamate--2,6-diaminopimelate ligase [Desulfobacteraceae bacterium]|nr:UDP-N-acetylmuramoyl-L-alanyl-D-glutamate--2,6-diaminopimelate ligase [Desulfobacteraceae bacterium]MBC2756030.1 UDP-N-acetylmuramoyl-L-alanyl-D-glutamate--2,6-diaminopimelate ligase [Desulfobacteraceae bacterium]